jgi:hypothetical protein
MCGAAKLLAGTRSPTRAGMFEDTPPGPILATGHHLRDVATSRLDQEGSAPSILWTWNAGVVVEVSRRASARPMTTQTGGRRHSQPHSALAVASSDILEPVLTDGQVLGATLLLTLLRIDMRRWP